MVHPPYKTPSLVPCEWWHTTCSTTLMCKCFTHLILFFTHLIFFVSMLVGLISMLISASFVNLASLTTVSSTAPSVLGSARLGVPGGDQNNYNIINQFWEDPTHLLYNSDTESKTFRKTNTHFKDFVHLIMRPESNIM